MANALKGEVDATIGDVTVTLAATMDGLAQLSAATGRPTMLELVQRLVGGELDTVMAAVRLFTVRGKDAKGIPLNRRSAVDEAVKALSLSRVPPLAAKFSEMVDALFSDAPAAGAEPPNG